MPRAMVALSEEHTEILDALSGIHFNLARTQWVRTMIEASLPVVLDEMEMMHPDKLAEIKLLRRKLTRQGPAQVIDLNARRAALRQQLERERV